MKTMGNDPRPRLHQVGSRRLWHMSTWTPQFSRRSLASHPVMRSPRRLASLLWAVAGGWRMSKSRSSWALCTLSPVTANPPAAFACQQ